MSSKRKFAGTGCSKGPCPATGVGPSSLLHFPLFATKMVCHHCSRGLHRHPTDIAPAADIRAPCGRLILITKENQAPLCSELHPGNAAGHCREMMHSFPSGMQGPGPLGVALECVILLNGNSQLKGRRSCVYGKPVRLLERINLCKVVPTTEC